MHYNSFAMLKATAQIAAECEVAGYASLHCTECVLLKASQTNTAKFLLTSLDYENWSNGAEGFMGFP